MTKGQAEHLIPMIEQVLAEGGASMKDLDCIGVGVGPGNFTGVRIAVSAARGLSLALGVPAVGVSRLEALAFGFDGVVVSSIDARRGQIYVQVFGDTAGRSPALCTLDSLPPIPARAEPVCVGHVAEQIAGHCAGRVETAQFEPACAIANIARIKRHSVTERPKPLYLRAADAAPPREAAPKILL